MPTPTLAPLLTIGLIGWIMYRRIRRQFGRQPFTPKRQIARLAVLGLAMLGLLALAIGQIRFALPIGVGLIGGALVAMVNLRLTRFEWTADGDYYYPHPYVGAALSLLLVGRLIYRSAIIGGMAGIGNQPAPLAGQSPLTYGLLALLVGYYVAYSSGLLIARNRHHRTATV